MAEMIVRMLTTDGKRMAVRLDASTWQAIDWLAQQAGQTWQAWSQAVLRTADPAAKNLTAEIRQAAMDALLSKTIFAERADCLNAMERHPIMRNSGMLDDHQLEDILSNAVVDGRSDFGGFSVIYGSDENDQRCIWIRNGLRDGLHFAFVVPVDVEAA